MRALLASLSLIALTVLAARAEARGAIAVLAHPVAASPGGTPHTLNCSASALGTLNGCLVYPDWSEAAPETPESPPPAPQQHRGEGPMTVQSSGGVNVIRGPGSHHPSP